MLNTVLVVQQILICDFTVVRTCVSVILTRLVVKKAPVVQRRIFKSCKHYSHKVFYSESKYASQLKSISDASHLSDSNSSTGQVSIKEKLKSAQVKLKIALTQAKNYGRSVPL